MVRFRHLPQKFGRQEKEKEEAEMEMDIDGHINSLSSSRDEVLIKSYNCK